MQKRKQELEPEKDSSFGSSYNEKIVVAILAIDFLLLPILLTSGKLDYNSSNALDAICISLPSAAGYLMMRVTLGVSKQGWQVIHDNLSWCSTILKFFFFTCLYYGAVAPCLSAVLYTILHVSYHAGLLLLLSVGVIFFFVGIFTILSMWFFMKRKKTQTSHVQPIERLNTTSRDTVG